MKDLIKKLVEAWGPSGFEDEVRELIRAEVEPLVDEVRVDALGNLIARKGSGGTKIMMAGHMDEIGIMVNHIDKNGFLRFTNIGGLIPSTLYANRVKFQDGTIGTIGMPDAFQRKPPEGRGVGGFFIDVSTGDGTTADIKVGDVASMWRPFEERGDRLIAKAFDDRIGCAVMIEALKRLEDSPNELYFVFTVQEEVGVRGAQTSAYGIDPDLGIAVDITLSPDVPKESMKMAVELGKGAAIKIRDSGQIVPPKVRDLMIKRAEEAGIPYQREVLAAGGTDAHAIQQTRAGVPSGCISIPTRYGHTTSETIDINDVEACVNLLKEIIGKPVEF